MDNLFDLTSFSTVLQDDGRVIMKCCAHCSTVCDVCKYKDATAVYLVHQQKYMTIPLRHSLTKLSFF